MLSTFFTQPNLALDNFFENEFFDRSILSAPRSEVKKEEDSWKIFIALLGFKKEDLKIETTENTVCISGEITGDVPNFVTQTKFKRSWKLKDLDTDSVDASLENGILEVTLKTKESIDPTKKVIEIK